MSRYEGISRVLVPGYEEGISAEVRGYCRGTRVLVPGHEGYCRGTRVSPWYEGISVEVRGHEREHQRGYQCWYEDQCWGNI